MSDIADAVNRVRRFSGTAKNPVGSRMDAYLRAYEQMGYFSGSVLVAYDGEVVLNEGYGMASLEYEADNTRNTIFRVGSVSKSFTAAAILILHEQGVIDADQTIDCYLTGFPNGDRITIHHLLTHTSGLAHPVGLNTKASMKLENVVQKFRDQPLVFPPGDSFQYTNSGYILLTYLIEQVTGKAYDRYLQEHIFGPLGMGRSGYDIHKRILKGRASGYSALEDRIVPGEFMDMSTQAGAAGLYSTTLDLQIWDEALHSGRLLSRESRERMFTPQLQNYGNGWYIDQPSIGGGLRKRIYHGGTSDSGYCSRVTRFVDERLLIVLLSNFLLSPLQTIERDLAGMAFGDTVELPQLREPLTPARVMRFESLAGIYEAFMPISVTMEQGRLFIMVFGFKLELFLQADAGEQIDFYAKAAFVDVSFKKNTSGEIAGAVIRWLGEDGYYAERK